MAEAGVGIVPIRADTDGLQADMQRGVESGLSSLSSRMQDFGRNLFRSGAQITAAISAPIALGFKAAFDSASDLNETMSAVDTIFKDQAGVIRAWSDTAASSFGQSRQQAAAAATGFGNMFLQLGIGGEHAARMSTRMVELASDFASFHNADITEVLNAQSAAFRGEYDSVQRFVPTINAAAVEERAMAMGLAATTSELTQQDKAWATQALLIEGAGDAMGDFDRTAGSAANQQRILRAQFDDAISQLGQQLIPIFLRVVTVLKEVVTWFANLGQPMQGIILGALALLAALGPIVTIVGAVSTALGVLISPITLVVLAIAAVVAALVVAYMRFEGFRDLVDGVVQAVIGFVSSLAERLNQLFRAIIDGDIQGIAEVVDAIFGNSGRFVAPIRSAIEFIVNTVVPAITAFVQHIISSFQDAVTFVQTIWPQISEAVGHVLAVVQGIIEAFVAFVTALWNTFGNEIIAAVTIAWETIRAVVEAAITIVQGIISTVLALINGEWGQVWEGIKTVVDGIWQLIVGLVTSAINSVQTVISAVLSAISAIWSAGWELVKTIVSAAWDAIVGFVSSGLDRALGFVTSILGTIGSAFTNAWNGIRTTVSGAVDAVVGFIAAIPGRIASFVNTAFDAIPDAFRGAINAVIGVWNRLRIPGFRIDIDLPGPIPDINFGFDGFDLPNIPTLHAGGLVPGLLGAETPVLAQAGELIVPSARVRELLDRLEVDGAGGNSETRVQVFIGDEEITQFMTKKVLVAAGLDRQTLRSYL